MQKAYKNIVIDSKTYESLRELGKAGESFNEVIGKLVKAWDSKN